MPNSPPQSSRAVEQMEDFNLREVASSSGAWAVAFAALGRLLKLRRSTEKQPLLRWSLLWELPTVIAMGYFGTGVAEYLKWPPDSFRTLALALSFGYLGPEWLERGIEKVLPLLSKK